LRPAFFGKWSLLCNTAERLFTRGELGGKSPDRDDPRRRRKAQTIAVEIP
jgi:hypothetical protein